MPLNKTIFISLWAAMIFAQHAMATELVYVPVNPNFGGNPNNGAMLLSNAQAQDKHKDPNAGGGLYGSGSSLDDFNQLLQRSILSRISAAVTSSIVGTSGELIPGTIETTDFIIDIADLGGGLIQITTTDKITGEYTSFQITQ